MDLFAANPDANLLPCDGSVLYHGPVMDAAEAERNFRTLLTDISWRNDEAVMFGKRIVTARKVAWYGDSDFSYTYSGTTKLALTWTDELLALKALAEARTGADFNSCLLNLYHNGNEGMAWHSDDERALRPGAAIASLSFGAERKFCFKHKREPERAVSLILESGSLLVMAGDTQKNWLHRLPQTKKVATPRINLTFRTIIRQGE